MFPCPMPVTGEARNVREHWPGARSHTGRTVLKIWGTGRAVGGGEEAQRLPEQPADFRPEQEKGELGGTLTVAQQTFSSS